MTRSNSKPRTPFDDTEWITLIPYNRHTLLCALWFISTITLLGGLTKALG